MSESTKTYKVKANDFVFFFDQAAIDAADFFKKSPGEFNLIMDHRSVNADCWKQTSMGKRSNWKWTANPLRWK